MIIQNTVVKKENICITLHFISILITSIDYYGDGEMENMSNTSEVVGKFFLFKENLLLFIYSFVLYSVILIRFFI